MNGKRRAGVDIAGLYDAGSWGTLQKTTVILASLVYGVDGLANQILGAAIPALVEDWHVPRAAFAPVAGFGLFGMVIGTVIFGMIGDRFGRRVAAVGSVALFACVTVFISLAQNVETLIALRFLDGLGLGGAIPTATTLIADMTPMRRRALAISVAGVFIGVGGMAAGLVASQVLPVYGWRALFLIGGVVSASVALLLLFFLTESPRYLVRRPDRRRQLLTVLRRSGHTIDSGADITDSASPPGRAKFFSILGPGLRRDTLALWTMMFFQMMAAYIGLTWIPTMLKGRGFDLAGTSLGLTAWNTGGTLAAFVAAGVLHIFGTRVALLLFIGGAAAGAGLLALAPPTPDDMTFAMLILGTEGIFLAAVQTASYTLAAYVYPPALRTTGVGVALGTGRAGAIAATYIGVAALDWGGSEAYFVLLGSCLGIAFLFCLLIGKHAPPGRGAA